MDFDQSSFGDDPDQECGQLERLEELFSVLDLAESQVSVVCILYVGGDMYDKLPVTCESGKIFGK